VACRSRLHESVWPPGGADTGGISVGHKTALYERHLALGARVVDFGGWDMPLHYGSQVEEHHAVRRNAGVFDVSHMRVVDVSGGGATEFLRQLLANDVARLPPGKALYSCMLNDGGGVVDDLIVYARQDQTYRLIVNAGTADRDVVWIHEHVGSREVSVLERRDLAILAVQGPRAFDVARSWLGSDASAAESLPSFAALELSARRAGFLGRTGYTGEDGFELVLPASHIADAWDAFVDAGARPCGLGARDTLRLEAGMNLYGNDMDETTTPLESGLAWTVSWSPGRDFVGRAALEKQQEGGVPRQLVGLLLEDKGVLRSHQTVHLTDGGLGETTSGTYSPTLDRSIAFARIPSGPVEQVHVDVRGRRLRARVVRPPFVRHGTAQIPT
jgi:aminomethyltransferase